MYPLNSFRLVFKAARVVMVARAHRVAGSDANAG